MTARQTAATIDEYIVGFPPETQALLEQVRAICREEAPGATEDHQLRHPDVRPEREAPLSLRRLQEPPRFLSDGQGRRGLRR